MRAVSRSAAARQLAKDLGSVFAVTVTAKYDRTLSRGPRYTPWVYPEPGWWTLSWCDGPTTKALSTALKHRLPRHWSYVDDFLLDRTNSTLAYTTMAVRYMRMRSDVTDPPPYNELCGAVMRLSQETDYPELPLDDIEAGLVRCFQAAMNRRFTAWGPSALSRTISNGMVGLFDKGSESHVDGPAWAQCFVTSKYAQGEDRQRWLSQLQPMSAIEAVQAARLEMETLRSAAAALLPSAHVELDALVRDLAQQAVVLSST